MSAPPIDPLDAITPEAFRDPKAFKKSLMDQLRCSGDTGAVDYPKAFSRAW